MTKRLLIEAEVAEILRCSTTKVKRLRLSGQLPFLPGRPVLISTDDLDAYIAATTTRAEQKAVKRVAKPSDSLEDARNWAKQAVLLKRDRKPRSKG